MIYVYCPRISDGARYLSQHLNATRVQMEKGKGKYVTALPGGLTQTDVIVVWGQRVEVPTGPRVLNAKAPIGNKYKELLLLQQAGVPCPEVRGYGGDGWVGRNFHHQSGNDLIKGTGRDYWVKLVPNVVHELRLHVFNGRVFRTGIKVHDPKEPNHHPVFRTWNTGWVVRYDRHLVNVVETAHYWRHAVNAVKALDYDFGAVDLGIRADGSPVVFEVNSAPGLDGMTIQRYAEQITAYAERK